MVPLNARGFAYLREIADPEGIGKFAMNPLGWNGGVRYLTIQQ
jgi:hypothetical protein